MADEPRGSFELEPAPIGPRRRRLDPLALGVAVVVTGLALAIVKPWDNGPADRASTLAPASPIAVATTEPTTPGARRSELPPAARVLGALRKRDAWGVRAVVSNQDGEADRWVATPIETVRADAIRIGGGTERIVALGVTSPSQETPLAVRIWRPTSDWGWQWLDVRPVASDAPGGDLLFWPPTTGGNEPGTWPAGRYRIDVLLGTTIERIEIALPGRFERVPAPRPADVPPGEILGSTHVDLAGIPTGPFALADGVAVGLGTEIPRDATDATAWLRPPGVQGTSSAWLPRADSIGVAFPTRALDPDAAIRRLDPGPPLAVPVENGAAEGPDGATPYALFRAPTGAVWRPGLYAIDATWFEAADEVSKTWIVELVPSADHREPPLLAAAREFSAFAGSTGEIQAPSLVLRLEVDQQPQPLSGIGPAPSRVLSIRPGAGTLDAADIGCGTFRIGRPGVIGIVGGLPDPIGPVTLRIVGSSGRSRLQRIRVARDVEGLLMIAPEPGESFADGVHRLTIDGVDPGERQQVRVCIGDGPFTG